MIHRTTKVGDVVTNQSFGCMYTMEGTELIEGRGKAVLSFLGLDVTFVGNVFQAQPVEG